MALPQGYSFRASENRTSTASKSDFDLNAVERSSVGGDQQSLCSTGTTHAHLLGERYLPNTFRYESLEPSLERQHITGIAFSGTVGIGLFITSGEFISVSGSLGAVLSFICAGFIVIGVMRCLAEMVSVRPVSGALIDFPATFVDEALGFATGVSYWIAQCLSMATLTSAAARIANNFRSQQALDRSQTAGIIVGLLLITLLSNICGVRMYGNLERVVKWIKLVILVSLCVLMVLVNVGVGGYNHGSPTRNMTVVPDWKPAGYNGTQWNGKVTPDQGVPGSTGQFLSMWVSITNAIFPCMGGDIVIVAAGEAANPRHDLPAAARFMYLVPLGFYVLGSFLVGLNVNFTDPDLFRPWLNKALHGNFESPSPFIIVLKHSSLAPNVLPTVLCALFLFCAYTTANTALFVSSRTLFALVHHYGNDFLRSTVGRTNNGHTPLVAIFCCSLFGLLAFLGLADVTFNQPVLCMSAFFTGAMACVYISECIAFLRFRWGLSKREALGLPARNDPIYTQKYYRAHWQPLWAYVGLVGCTLIMIFSGWPAIYILSARHLLVDGGDLQPSHVLAWELVGSYAGPIFFISLFVGYKMMHRGSTWKTFESFKEVYDLSDKHYDGFADSSRLQDRRSGWAAQVWSFIR